MPADALPESDVREAFHDAGEGDARAPNVRRRLAEGGAWAIVGRGGALLLNFTTTVLVTRLLVPADAGAYFLAQSLVGVSALVARLGLDHTVVYLVSTALGAGDPGRARVVVRRILALGVAATTPVVVFLVLGGVRWLARAAFDSSALSNLGPSVGLWCGALALGTLFSEALRGFHAIRDSVLYGWLAAGALTIAGLVAVHVWFPGAGVHAAASVTAIATLAGAAASLAALSSRTRALSAPARTTQGLGYRDILRTALPVLASNLTAFLLGQVGLWAVATVLPERDVAVFSAANRVAATVAFPFIVANHVLPPLIGELAVRKDTVRLERVLRGVTFVATVPALACLGEAALEGGSVMRAAFGPFYGSGGELLFVLGVAQLASALAGTSTLALLMTGRGLDATWLGVASAAAAACAAFGVARPFGAMGVAQAIAAVMMVQQIATLAVVKRRLGVWSHPGAAAVFGEIRRLRKR